jgi:hypothetical protein
VIRPWEILAWETVAWEIVGRLFLLLRVLLPSLLVPVSFATQEVVAPRVRVVFDDPALAAYAQRVAREAEGALDALVPLFGVPPPPIVLWVEGGTDVYNGFAAPLPRPTVGLRALFPTDTSLGYGAESELELLLVHELTHVLQFAFLEGRKVPRLGLVGETVATPPPAWLIEGLAVWAESEFTQGGRRDAALTRGVLESAALLGTWPSLEDVSLSTFAAWPGAQAQYLFGGGFTAYLIERHGFEAVRQSLRAYNAGGILRPFAVAWREAVGVDLEAECAAWYEEVLARAKVRAAEVDKERGVGVRRTETGWYTRAPTPSPDGKMLAWVSWPAAIKVAEIGPRGALRRERTLLTDRLPTVLAWLDARTLVYVRTAPGPGRVFSELFALDVLTGNERQLTEGARAHLPAVTPERCVLFVRDVLPERARLDEWCDGALRTRWRAPEGVHPVGVAVSPEGQVALSVWQRGAVRLALLEAGRLRLLTPPELQALEPAWRGEGSLLFRAVGPQGVAELFEFSLAGGRLVQRTRTLGGASAPAPSPEGEGVWYVALGGGGYDVAFLADADALQEAVLHIPIPPTSPETWSPAGYAERGPFPVRPYTPLPSLVPFGWLPTSGDLRVAPLGGAAEVSVLGLDDTAAHSYAAVLGFTTELTGSSGYGYVRYDYGAYEGLRAVPRPLRFGVQMGAWPYAGGGVSEVAAFGVRAWVGARLPFDRYTASLHAEGAAFGLPNPSGVGGLLEVSAHAALAEERTDPWGYRVRGGRVTLHGVWSSAPQSLGVWGEGVMARTEAGWGVEVSWLAGFRPRWLLPVPLATDVAVLSTLGLRRSLPLVLRYGDGLYAAERVTLEPRLRLWLDGALHVGADLTASLDAVVGYGLPVSFGVTLGYAGGLWLGVGPQTAF